MKSIAFLAFGVMLLAAPVFAQDKGSSGADTNWEILKQKIKADKKLLVANNMGLSDAEGKQFWPLYDAYQKELEQINQRIGKMINDYADAYNAGKGTISNETAKKLLNEALAIEDAEAKLKRAYAEKIGQVLPATKTARYIQIENKIRAIIKVELVKQIPLVY